MNKGWVKIYRRISESDFWISEEFTKPQAWIDLVLNANHKGGSFWVRGIEVKIKRGQIGWSELTMAERWGWSRGKVRRFIKWLINDLKVEQHTIQHITTILSLIKYDEYQSGDTTNHTTDGQQTDNRRYTNKNDKNDKNKEREKDSFKKMVEDGRLPTKEEDPTGQYSILITNGIGKWENGKYVENLTALNNYVVKYNK